MLLALRGARSVNELTRFKVGAWTVVPALNVLEREGESLKLEPRAMDLLVYLATARERVVSADELLREVWQGRVFDDGIVYKRINQLRKALGDDPQDPRFIETIPKRGYRLIAAVVVSEAHDSSPFVNGERIVATVQEHTETVSRPTVESKGRQFAVVTAVATTAVVAMVGAAVFGFWGATRDPPLRTMPWSVAKGEQWSPVWSPDGRATAFVVRSSVGEPAQISIRALDEPIGRLIARRDRIPAIAQWTTTGKILFWEGTELWSVSPVGAPPELVAAIEHDGLGIGADITRSGTIVATVARGEDGSFGIWTATPLGAELERYEPAPFAARRHYNSPVLRFSPDGRQLLLFWYAADRGEEAWLMPFPPDVNSPPHRILQRLPALGGTPQFSWLPDNRHVVLSTGSGLQRELYLADTRSGKYRLLASGPSNQVNPVVSPDGSRLVLTDLRRDFDIVTLDQRRPT